MLSSSAFGRVSALGILLGAVIIACSGENPGTAGSPDFFPDPPASCGTTPQDGCPCGAPGEEVDCGKVVQQSGGYVLCSLGKRVCTTQNKWGNCSSTTLQPRAIPPMSSGGGLKTLAFLGPCPTNPANPLSNVCDPYCTQYMDEGGVLEGGISLGLPDGGPAGDAGDGGDGGAGGGGFVSTANGTSGCNPVGNNLGGSTCVPGPGEFAQCKQDFRCVSGTCVWNGGPGYYDPTAGGPDLTVGAPCGPNGSATSTVPVCNRGSVAVPAGSPITLHRTNGSPPNPCTDLGPPTFSFTLGAALNPGECTSFSVSNSLGNKDITVNAGVPGSQPVNEAPNRCANNQAYWKTEGGGGDCAACNACDTRVSGTVFDPGQNVPLTGVTVFQPAGALTPLTDGVQCDNCTNIESPAITKVGTFIDGTFSLPNVTPGPATRIVVQSGRWRREITTNVTACIDNPKPAGTFRMPRNSAEGNIPKMAIVMGDQETLECMFRKIGVDAAEIRPRGSGGRIQLWNSGNGMITTPAAPNVSGLAGNSAVLNEYTAIFWDCDGGDYYAGTYSQSAPAADKTRLRDYTNAGGKMFMDHFDGDLVRTGPAPENAITSWYTPPPPMWYGQGYNGLFSPIGDEGRLLTTTAAQQQMHDWLSGPAAAMTDYGAPFIRIDQPRRHAVDPNPALTVQWIRGHHTDGWGGQPAGTYSNSFSYETPITAADCGQPNGHGRVIYNGMHVSGSRHTGGGFPGGKAFPGACNLAAPLTPEEKALEYQIFQLTACQLGGGAPPPVPVTPLPVIYYQLDYEGICPEGTGTFPEWTWVYWQSTTPLTSRIDFHVATADTQALLPAGPPTPGPNIIHVGEASGAPVAAPAWATHASNGSIAQQLLTEASATPKSKRWLRLFLTFVPDGATPPTLEAWRVQFSCVPVE